MVRETERKNKRRKWKMQSDCLAVSVIVPVYNVERYLEKCIKSVIDQTLKNIEILLINDGSSDGSQRIIERYQDEYPEVIKSYIKENGGLSSARNFALELARGTYITFLDSDDYLEKDYLEKLYNVAVKNDADMVCSGQKKVTESGEVLATLSYPIDKNPNTILRRLNISGKIYKREYIEKHRMRFALNKTYEDDPFNLVLLFMADNFEIVKYEGYNQLVHEGSITSKKIRAEKIPYKALESSISYVVNNKKDVNNYDVFEYTVLSFFTYFIFQANRKHMYLKKGRERKSDCNVVLEFCDFTQKILHTYMPNYYKNKNIGIFKNRELQLTQRCGVWLYVKLCRLGMLKTFTKIYYKF